MPARHPMFRFGSFVVRISECPIPLLTVDPCIGLSCSQHSICLPPGRTLAKLAFDPRKTNPAEFKRLLQEVQRLELQPEIVVRTDPQDRTLAHEHVEQALK